MRYAPSCTFLHLLDLGIVKQLTQAMGGVVLGVSGGPALVDLLADLVQLVQRFLGAALPHLVGGEAHRVCDHLHTHHRNAFGVQGLGERKVRLSLWVGWLGMGDEGFWF